MNFFFDQKKMTQQNERQEEAKKEHRKEVQRDQVDFPFHTCTYNLDFLSLKR